MSELKRRVRSLAQVAHCDSQPGSCGHEPTGTGGGRSSGASSSGASSCGASRGMVCFLWSCAHRERGRQLGRVVMWRVGGSGGRPSTCRVNLTGPLQAAGPEQLGKLKLSQGDAQLVRSQGAFVNADRVSEAK